MPRRPARPSWRRLQPRLTRQARCHTRAAGIASFLQLAKAGIVPVYGLDYKDKPDDGRAWLAKNGDPYTASVVDLDGRVGIDYGVYGVPETFVIDRSGIVRYKQIGPLSVELLQEKILPLVRELQK